MDVRLWEKGDEPPSEFIRITRKGKLCISVPMAVHDPISHYLGKPCIVILPKLKGYRYPMVHARNIVYVLNHESLHCALMNIGEETGSGEEKTFDNLFGDKKFRNRLKRTGLL
jgi:hypothetical protein